MVAQVWVGPSGGCRTYTNSGPVFPDSPGVYGADDPKAGAAGSLWDVVCDRRLNHRPEVVSGVLAEESTALLLGFFAGQRGADFSPTEPL